MSLKIGALFAGYGGLDMAVMDVLDAGLAWYAELDEAPAKVMAHHHPDVPNLWDVTKVDWSTVEPVDIITGGSPCQDLTPAGRLLGMHPGTRSGLWSSMCNAIDTIRPRLVVWENVRGALSAGAGSALEPCPRCMGDPRNRRPVLRALGRVLGDLAELRYDAWWVGLRASDVGAPHGRFRIFLVATPGHPDLSGLEGRGTGRRSGEPPTGSHGVGLGRLSRDELVQVDDRNGPSADGIGDRVRVGSPGAGDEPDSGSGQGLPDGALDGGEVSGGLSGGDEREGCHGTTLSARNRRVNTPGELSARLLPTPEAGLGDHGRDNGTDPDRRIAQGRQVSLADLACHPRRWGVYADAIARAEAVLGRPAPPPTERNARGGARLSPAFVEWMMMLPAGHVTDPAIGLTRPEQLKALGNGVVPPQAAAALRAYLADEAVAA